MSYMRWIFGSLMVILLAGCARFPSTPVNPTVPPKTILAQVTVAGQIDPTMWYHLAINTDGDPDNGPVPVVTGPDLGNGWGVLKKLGPGNVPVQPPFFVRYHNGTFQQYINGQPAGQPFRGEVSADGKSLLVEIDTSLLGAVEPSFVTLNWITDENIDTQPQNPLVPKEYDGFGPRGTDYIEVPLGVPNTWISGQNGVLEELPGDTTIIDNIDEVGWRVEVRINPVQ